MDYWGDALWKLPDRRLVKTRRVVAVCVCGVVAVRTIARRLPTGPLSDAFGIAGGMFLVILVGAMTYGVATAMSLREAERKRRLEANPH
jgi:hypothetical protein